MSKTHVLMAVDKSGSMAALTNNVIRGFNDYLDGLGAEPDGVEYQLSVVLFDTLWYPLHDDKPVAEIPKWDRETYVAAGYTALLDAVGKLITKAPDFPPEDRVLVVIQTDGHENSSREFKLEAVRELISQKQNAGWGFLFQGQGPEGWDQASQLGISQASTVTTKPTAAGTQSRYRNLRGATVAYAASPGGQAAADAANQAQDWSAGSDQAGPTPEPQKVGAAGKSKEAKESKPPTGEPM